MQPTAPQLMRVLITLLSLTVGQMPSLAAQWPAEIAPGTRVQVRLPETQYQFSGSRGHLLRGRVTALSPDTLYLAVTDSIGPLAIPRLLIDKLAFSRGVPSRAHSALKRGFYPVSFLRYCWRASPSSMMILAHGTREKQRWWAVE
jgi:hypothetical protein